MGGNGGSPKRKSRGRVGYLKRQKMAGKYNPAVAVRGGGGEGGRRKRPREALTPGMKGFLCTTNSNEGGCIMDAYNILNEYSQNDDDTKAANEKEVEDSSPKTVRTEVEGGGQKKVEDTVCENPERTETDPETKDADDTQMDAEAGKEEKKMVEEEDSDEEDVDAALANELKELKSGKTPRKFQCVDTGVTNVLFIKTTIEDPIGLVTKIFKDVSAKKLTKSRHLLRLMPVEVTCNSNNLDEVKARVRELVMKYMSSGYLSYKINCRVRNNTSIGKTDDLIHILADLVSRVNPLSFVDLGNPKFVIFVEVLKTTMCLGVLENFNEFKKYNLISRSGSSNKGRKHSRV